MLRLAKLCTSSDASQLLKQVVSDQDNGQCNDSKKLLSFSAIKEIECYVTHAGTMNTNTWRTYSAVIDELVVSWIAAQNYRNRRKEENDRLYRSSTVDHEGELSDALAEKKALQQLFPSYEQDYVTDTNNGDHSMEVDVDDDEAVLDFDLSADDQLLISRSHVSLTSWTRSMLISKKKATDKRGSSQDASEGFLMRYPLLKPMTSALQPCFSTQLDRRLVGAHVIYADHLLKIEEQVLLQPEEATKHFDFYYDPCVVKALQCRPLLEKLRSRIDELLEEFPGFANLCDIRQLIERILGFTVTSPLMKLVTGIEMVLARCQEWEQNAHKGVSLNAEMTSLSELVIDWRKLELKCWRTCLDGIEKRVAADASKLWFHLYSTISTMLKRNSGQVSDMEQVQQTLRQFMESASLGQYESRLAMINAFVAHVIQSTPSGRNEEQQQLLCILWHTALFYGQFSGQVERKRRTLKAPVEKKLRDFIKIMHANPRNYYAMKEAVNKAHCTVLRHMKEWRAALDQPARTVLMEPGVDQETDATDATDATADWTLTVAPFITTGPVEAVSGAAAAAAAAVSATILTRLPTLLNKCRRYTSMALEKCPLQARILLMDDYVATVAATVHSLQKLKVISGSDKESQRREANMISMRKRNALSRLITDLERLGVSYGRGSIVWKSSLDVFESILPVLEVEASLQHLPHRSTHSTIGSVWNKCPAYYARCMARLAAMAKLLEKPNAELGKFVVKCKGSAAHFMLIIQDQWRQCHQTHEQLVTLRLLLGQLAAPCGDVPPSVFVEQVNRLWLLVVDGLAVVDEFHSLMKACPDAHQGK